MTAPDRISLHAAVGDLSVVPVPDGATVGSLGEDSVLLPERQWETLRAAAKAVLNGQQIWWCEVHQCNAANRGVDHCLFAQLSEHSSSCRMVVRLLVEAPE